MYLNRYIKVTKENEKEVLEVLEELGFTWGGSQLAGSLKNPTEYKPINEGWVCGDIYLETPSNKEISFMNGNKIYIMRGIKEITLKELKSFLPNKTPKIIKKLKDLDGLKNDRGWELSFESTDNFKDKGYYQEWVRLDDKSNKGWFNAFYELTDKTIDSLKASGFKFEYKPLRKLEEVFNEMSSLNPFKKHDFDTYSICGSVEGNGYSIYKNTSTGVIGYSFDKETAQKYVYELNEILGSN